MPLEVGDVIEYQVVVENTGNTTLTNVTVDDPLAPLLGVRPYPSRIRCATLPWETALRAIP